MTRLNLAKFAMSAFLTVAISLSAASHAAIIASGSLTDALEGSNTDLSSASITVDSSGAITFSVTLGPAAILNTAYVQFALDTDQNPATGFAGIDSANSDAALMGSDYTVIIRSSAFQANALVRAFSGGVFTTVATLPVTYLGSTFSTVGNLSDLGNDDGLMNFKAVGVQQLSNLSTTGIQDYISDVGQPVGTVAAVPVPATWLLISAGLLVLCARRRGMTDGNRSITQ